MYTAYFDESGTEEHGGFVCLAGFVTSDARWEAFNREWNAALAAKNTFRAQTQTSFQTSS